MMNPPPLLKITLIYKSVRIKVLIDFGTVTFGIDIFFFQFDYYVLLNMIGQLFVYYIIRIHTTACNTS